jgi:hypothetical protein
VKRVFALSVLVVALLSVSFAQDPGWPRAITKNGAKLIYYQPQIDDWKDQKELEARSAISLTPAGGKQVIGVVSVRMRTNADSDTHTVLLSNVQVTKTFFPQLDPEKNREMDQLVRSLLSPNATMTISLDRLVAAVNSRRLLRQRQRQSRMIHRRYLWVMVRPCSCW